MTENIYFKSVKHKQRFTDIIKELHHYESDGWLDKEYGTALYVLTADDEIWKKSQDYVSERGLDLEDMLEGVDLSSGYKLLVKLANNLYNGRTPVDPCSLAATLDNENFYVAISAQWLRRFGAKLSDFE